MIVTGCLAEATRVVVRRREECFADTDWVGDGLGIVSALWQARWKWTLG